MRHGLSGRAGVSRRPGTRPYARYPARPAHQRPPFSRITGEPATREIASDRAGVMAQHVPALVLRAGTPPAERPPAGRSQHQRTRQGDVSAGHAACRKEQPARPPDTSGTVLIPGMSPGVQVQARRTGTKRSLSEPFRYTAFYRTGSVIMTHFVNLHGDPTGSRAIRIPGRCGRAYVSSDWTLPARPHNSLYLLAHRNAQGKGPGRPSPSRVATQVRT